MPAEHVNKLFRMLQDIEVNKDLNSSFKKSLVGTNNNKTLSGIVYIKSFPLAFFPLIKKC